MTTVEIFALLAVSSTTVLGLWLCCQDEEIMPKGLKAYIFFLAILAWFSTGHIVAERRFKQPSINCPDIRVHVW